MDNDLAYFTFYVDPFYAEQVSLAGRVWRRLRAAWALLRGKEYELYGLVLSRANAALLAGCITGRVVEEVKE